LLQEVRVRWLGETPRLAMSEVLTFDDRALHVPENLRIWSIMAVGTPTAQPARPPKPDFKEIVHFNRFGRQ